MMAVGALRANHDAKLVEIVVLPAPPLLLTTNNRLALINPSETKLLLSIALSGVEGETLSSSVVFKIRNLFQQRAGTVLSKRLRVVQAIRRKLPKRPLYRH